MEEYMNDEMGKAKEGRHHGLTALLWHLPQRIEKKHGNFTQDSR